MKISKMMFIVLPFATLFLAGCSDDINPVPTPTEFQATLIQNPASVKAQQFCENLMDYTRRNAEEQTKSCKETIKKANKARSKARKYLNKEEQKAIGIHYSDISPNNCNFMSSDDGVEEYEICMSYFQYQNGGIVQ